MMRFPCVYQKMKIKIETFCSEFEFYLSFIFNIVNHCAYRGSANVNAYRVGGAFFFIYLLFQIYHLAYLYQSHTYIKLHIYLNVKYFNFIIYFSFSV